jgi:hypothetical protein
MPDKSQPKPYVNCMPIRESFGMFECGLVVVKVAIHSGEDNVVGLIY